MRAIGSHRCSDAEAPHAAHTCWALAKSGILSTAAATICCFGGFFSVVVLVCLCEVNAPRRLLTALAAPRRSTSSSPITTPPPQSRLRSAPAESAVSEWALEWPRTASTLHVGSSGGEGQPSPARGKQIHFSLVIITVGLKSFIKDYKTGK